MRAKPDEMPEFEEEELEEEMMKMQIGMEMEMKKDGLQKVEMRRKEDEEKANQKFLDEVVLIEA